MSDNVFPQAEVQIPASGPGKEKKGYVKYSPLSLVLLSVCAFVFAFSMMGVFEQSVLDLAGSGMVDEILGFLKDENSGIFVSDPNKDEFGNPRQWQKIAPSEIDPNKLSFLQVNGFENLKKQNPDTKAWMYWPSTADVRGLPFNMPVVQTKDNDYYLNHSYDKSSHANGWVYFDYRCELADIRANRNLIVYAHARSYQMFGGLRYLNTKTKWQQDGYNHFIYLNTPNGKAIYQLFSWYETTTAHNYIDTYFGSDAEYVAFLNDLQSRNTISAFEKFEFTGNDRILTLSTCIGSNSDARIAVHAVLVRYEKIGNDPDLPPITPPPTTQMPGEGQPSWLPNSNKDTDVATNENTDGEVMPSDTPQPTDKPVDKPVDTGTVTDPSSGSAGTAKPPDSGTPPAPGTTDGGTATDKPIDSGTPTDKPTETEKPSENPTDTPTGNSSDVPTDQPVDTGTKPDTNPPSNP